MTECLEKGNRGSKKWDAEPLRSDTKKEKSEKTSLGVPEDWGSLAGTA